MEADSSPDDWLPEEPDDEEAFVPVPTLALAALPLPPLLFPAPFAVATTALPALRSLTVVVREASVFFTSADVLTASVAFDAASAARAFAVAAASRASSM